MTAPPDIPALIERLKDDAEWNHAPQLGNPSFLKTAALEREAITALTAQSQELAALKNKLNFMGALDKSLSDRNEELAALRAEVATFRDAVSRVESGMPISGATNISRKRLLQAIAILDAALSQRTAEGQEGEKI